MLTRDPIIVMRHGDPKYGSPCMYVSSFVNERAHAVSALGAMERSEAREVAAEVLDWRIDRAGVDAGVRVEWFWDEQAEWSRATFGADNERGPIGPTKHLAKEVLSELLNVPRDEVAALLAKSTGGTGITDVEEFADCLFLIFDASRRAGFTLQDLITAAEAKLTKNKSRQWGKPTSDEPVEHVR